MKKCKICEQEKSFEDFQSRVLKSGNIGYHSWCRKCQSIESAKARKKRESETKCSVDGCPKGASFKEAILCQMHYRRLKNNGEIGSAGSIKASDGEGSVRKDGYKIITVDGKSVREHRHVMELYLNRTLLPEETVHHKNGDRSDNRLENLELWSASQPSGQRVEDKVEWALELLRLYAPDKLILLEKV